MLSKKVSLMNIYSIILSKVELFFGNINVCIKSIKKGKGMINFKFRIVFNFERGGKEIGCRGVYRGILEVIVKCFILNFMVSI